MGRRRCLKYRRRCSAPRRRGLELRNRHSNPRRRHPEGGFGGSEYRRRHLNHRRRHPNHRRRYLQCRRRLILGRRCLCSGRNRGTPEQRGRRVTAPGKLVSPSEPGQDGIYPAANRDAVLEKPLIPGPSPRGGRVKSSRQISTLQGLATFSERRALRRMSPLWHRRRRSMNDAGCAGRRTAGQTHLPTL